MNAVRAAPADLAAGPAPRVGWREGLVVLALLLVQCGQLLHAVRADGMAFDELLYVASGHRHLVVGDHRFGAEHPPLARIMAAVPLLGLDLTVRALGPADLADWRWAYQFVHVDNVRHPLLTRARLATVALSLLLSVVLWRWSRSTDGRAAGVAALTLASFHPSLLAHGHLVTTDTAGALTMVVTSWALWRWCLAPTPARAALVGAALGAALATRLTALLLLPVMALLAVQWWWHAGRTRDGVNRLVILGLACLLLAPLVIWASYGFRHDAWPGEPMPSLVPSAWSAAFQGSTAAWLVAALKTAHVLPAAYVASIEVYAIKSAIGHEGYLLGAVSASGWPYYYLVALAVKNTPGFLVALAVCAAWWRRVRTPARLHWLLPAAFLFAAASLSKVQVGDRYIMGVYAYLIPVVASLAPALLRERGGAVVAAVVALLHAGPSLGATSAGHLPYFNALVGQSPHLVLSDSNLDWGQDLPRLAAWAAAHPGTRLQLAYWGSDDPGRYGIVRHDLPGYGLYPTVAPDRPFTGTVAVSPTLLAGLHGATRAIYRELGRRSPDDRAGVFLIYHLGP